VSGNTPVGSETNDDSDPIARIERLVAEGRIDQEAIIYAEQLWRTTLANGFLLPNGEPGVISRRDLYHLIVDSRIRRKPERIKCIVDGIFEIRTAKFGRRTALSEWSEENRSLVAYVILEEGNRIWTLHVVDAKRIRREQRKGIVLWKR
jgi:hypothetical protein